MMAKLWLLFREMFKIALCVVGGGFAILAVADEVFARKFKWTREGEIAEHLPVFQMVPGIIAGHTAVYVGRKIAGIPGAICAVAGVFLPSVAVFSAIAAGYRFIPLENRFLVAAFMGLRAALTGIIAAMVIRGWKKNVQGFYGYGALSVAVVALAAGRVNPAAVILWAIACGVAAKTLCRGAGSEGGRRFCVPVWTAIAAVFLKYGLIAFGGGYVLVPVYIGDFVGPLAPYLQLGEGEFADVMALTQMTPGPIAVNCATFFGYRMAGIAGALLATVCLLVPGTIILYVALGSLERFRNNPVVQGVVFGIKPVTIALMLNALWAFADQCVFTRADGFVWHPAATVLAVLSLWAAWRRKIGIVGLIFAVASTSAVLEGLIYFIENVFG